jgi:hypothetical protein
MFFLKRTKYSQEAAWQHGFGLNSARLQAGTVDSSTCPSAAADGRYKGVTYLRGLLMELSGRIVVITNRMSS